MVDREKRKKIISDKIIILNIYEPDHQGVRGTLRGEVVEWGSMLVDFVSGRGIFGASY